jgi:putative DNA primase/helicase
LPVKLLREAEGILAWAVAGAKEWDESGLNTPPEVEAANDQWRSDMDQIGRFIEEQCTVNESFRVAASALYAAYKRWAETGGEHPMPSKTFGTKMPDRGFLKKETSRGNVYLGIGLMASETESG